MAEPLRIRFASDVDAAKKGMADLSASVAANAIQMGMSLKAVNDNAQRVSSAMASLPSAARNLAQVAAALVALKIAADVVAVAVNAAKENLADLVKVGNDARAAGVGTNFFQAWTLQARELGTEAAKLEAMLTRAREAATVRIGEGGKEASSAILDRLEEHRKAGNVSAADVSRVSGAASQEARIRAIVDLIDQLREKGAQLAAFDLAGKMFGPDFESKLRSGVDMTGKMREALDGMAHAGGERVFTQDEINRAERINQQLVRIDNLMSQGLAPIQRDLVALGQQQYQSWLDIKEGIALAVVGAGKLYTLIKNTLDALDKFTGENPLGTLATKLGATALRDKLGIAPPADPPPLDVRVPAPKRGPDTSKSLPERAKETNEAKDAVESYISSLERSTAALEAEVQTYGKSNAEKQRAIALARGEAAAKERGADLTDEERRKIEALGTAAGRAKDQMGELQAASQRSAEAMRTFGQSGVDALADIITKSRTAEQVFADLAKQMLRWSLQAAILGTGPFAGMMGTAPAANGVGAASVGGLMGGVGQIFGGFFGGGTATSSTAGSPAAAAATPAVAGVARTIIEGLGLGAAARQIGPAVRTAIRPSTVSPGSPAAPVVDTPPLPVAVSPTTSLSDLPSWFSRIKPPVQPDWNRAQLSVNPAMEPLLPALKDKAAELAKSGDNLKDAVQSTADGVGSSGGDLINSLASLATKGLSGAGNLFSGSVPTSTIGANAEGTDDWRGGLSWVGEKGPEILNVPKGSQIIPNHKLPGMFAPKVDGARAGGTSNRVSAPLTVNQTISGNGDATIAAISQQAVQQGIGQHQQHIERNLGSIIANWQRRRG